MTMPMPWLLANHILGGAQGPAPGASTPPPLSTPLSTTPPAMEPLSTPPPEQNMTPAVPNPTTVTPAAPVKKSADAPTQALADAYTKVTGTAPTPDQLSIFRAHADFETGGFGKGFHGNNFGNIKATGTEPSQEMAAPEIINGQEVQQRSKFRTYGSLGEGAASYMQFLKQNYPDAFNAAQNGDPVAFSHALKQGGYYTANEDTYTKGLLGRMKNGLGDVQASGAPSTPNPLGDFITAGGSPGQVQHSRTTVEGIPETPEDIARRGDALGNAKADVVSAYAPAMQAAAENRIAAIDAQQRAQEKADLQEQQKALAKTTYDSAIADEKSATQAVLDDKAPKPFGGNTFSLILATIGQAMGAYGAAITKTRNFAADMINQFLDRDMQTWKEKHLDLKYKAESLSKLTSQRRSDFDFEANAHARLQDQVTMRELQVAQANTQNADQQTRLGLTLASLQERYDGHEEELQRLARDHSQTTTSITEKQTGAAGPEEEAKRTRQLVANGEDLGTVEAAREQAGRKGRIPLDKDQTATAEKLSKELEGLNGAETEVRAALHAMDEGKQKYGSVPGLGGGDLVPDWAYSMAQRLPGTAATGFAQKAEDARQTRQLVNRALTIGVVETVGKGHVGIERSPQLVEKLKAGASGLLEESDARKQLTDTLQQLQSRRRTFLAGVDDPMVRRQIDEESPQFAPVESAKPYQPSGTP